MRAVLDRLDRRELTIGLDADAQPARGRLTAPRDPDDSIDAAAQPLDADRHGRGLDDRRAELAGEAGRGILVGACGVLAHLVGGRRVVVHERDLVHPFDGRAAVPPRHDETDRRAVIGRERPAVHPGGQEGARLAEVVEAEDPARSRHRARVTDRMLVEARHEHPGGAGERPGALQHARQPDSRPPRDADEPEVRGP
ncbi:MAG TPA: hypothetical protein VGN09_27395 [Vicinamibacteria bacterium]